MSDCDYGEPWEGCRAGEDEDCPCRVLWSRGRDVPVARFLTLKDTEQDGYDHDGAWRNLRRAAACVNAMHRNGCSRDPEALEELLNAAKQRLRAGCNDTCGACLITGAPCDCGHEALRGALRDFAPKGYTMEMRDSELPGGEND